MCLYDLLVVSRLGVRLSQVFNHCPFVLWYVLLMVVSSCDVRGVLFAFNQQRQAINLLVVWGYVGVDEVRARRKWQAGKLQKPVFNFGTEGKCT